MKLIDKSDKDGGPVHLPWDAAQSALASGAYDSHRIEGERGPDQPAAQSPAPGTDPVDGKETVADGEVLPNLTAVGLSGAVANGLPREPAPPKSSDPVKPAAAPEANKQVVEVPVAVPVPAKAPAKP